jgi:ribonuclease VapC
LIVVDTSAVIAILFGESDGLRFEVAIAADARPVMSAMTDYETRLIAFQRQGQEALDDYLSIRANEDIAVVPFDDRQSMLAFDAYCRFGKGNHPARLNFADCAAYALAKSLDAPLLFKGNDFALTDVRIAI